MFRPYLLIFICLISKSGHSQSGPGGVGTSADNILWLKADAGTKNAGATNAVNGERIATWEDQSGNNNDVTQSTDAQRPTLSTNNVNGESALLFDGGDLLSNTSFTGMVSQSGGSVFTAIKANDNSINKVLFTTATASVGSFPRIQKYTTAGGHRWLGGALSNAWVYSSDSLVQSSTWYLYSQLYDGTQASAANRLDMWLDGDNQTVVAGSGSASTNTGTVTRVFLGNWYSGSYYFDGVIPEIILYNVTLNEAQRIIVENYLAAKYGLSISNDKFSFESTHNHEVAGIGRVDASNEHLAAQSASILETSSASSLGDGDYLLFGHDDGAIATWTNTETPYGGVNVNRLSREWKLSETGDVGSVKFTIDTTLLPVRTSNYTKYVLMVDSDGDFSAGASIYEMDSPGLDSLFETSSNVAIADGDYVTIGEIIPLVEYSSITSSGFEQSNASLNLGLNYIAKNTVSVTYNSADGSAVAPGDYTAVAGGSASITAGNQSTNISITVANDVLVESDEAFTVTISAPTAGVNVGDDSVHTYTIHDDDDSRKIYFTAASSTAAESVSPVALTVSIDVGQIDATNPTTINYTVSGGTATGGGSDFTLASGTATISATNQTTTFQITIVDDALYEASETIVVELSNPTNCNLSSINPTQYTYTITDNDNPPVIEFSSVASSGSESVTTVNVPLGLSFSSALDATVAYTISGSATGGGMDYILADGSATISVGSTSLNIVANIIDDSNEEFPETIVITLSSPTSSTLGNDSIYTYTINNDDLFGWKGPGGVGDSVNIALWLKADVGALNSGGTDAANAERIDTWEDQSGNGNDVTQSTDSRRPTFTTNVVNGKPVLAFDGGDQLDNTSLTGMADKSGGSIFGAFFPDDSSVNRVLFTTAATSTGSFPRIQKYTTGGGHRWLGGGNSGAWVYNSSTTVSASTWALYSQLYDGTEATASNRINMWLDGASQTVTAGSGSVSATTGSVNRVYVGNWLSGSYYFDGSIPEIALYNVELNESRRIIVENYIAAKYAFTISNDKFAYDASYGLEVAGIGRAAADDFHQDAQGTANVRINNPSSMDVGDYLLWGHNNDTIELVDTTDIPVAEGVDERWERSWRVTETNEIGTVDISFDLSHKTNITAGDLRLLIDKTNNGFSDETAGAGTVISGATDLGNKIYQFTGINLDDTWRFTLATIDNSQTPLPVALLDFSARAVQESFVELKWQTLTEVNSDFFTVERSSNGLSWKAVSKHKAAGNSKEIQRYSCKDFEPYDGESYYRLMQSDIDGRRSYSHVESVRFDFMKSLRVYPNPTNNQITVIGGKEMLSEFKIFDVLGQDVTASTTRSNIEDASLQIDLSALEAGTYFLKAGEYSEKLFKK